MKYVAKKETAAAITKIGTDCVVVAVYSKGALSPEARAIDAACDKVLSKIIGSGDFSGKLGETLLLHNLAGVKAGRVLLAGAGDNKKFDAKACVKMLQASLSVLLKSQAKSVHFGLTSVKVKDRNGKWLSERLAIETERACYRYDETKSKKAEPLAMETLSVATPAGSLRPTVNIALQQGEIIGRAINHARQLGNLPGNICTPDWLAAHARKLAGRHKSLNINVLGETQMQQLGMGSLLSVAAGSAQEAKLIVLRYRGRGRGRATADKPVVLVGKGITFDTGGISLKPGLNMDHMKFDMCGAASVIATMQGVAELKLPVNVVGVVAAAENMPGSKATKPGDIVTSMAGKTIEVLNTDAEGRLVLCDALSYSERFKPRVVIDIATLTGAAVATFGSHVNALLSNNRQLADALLKTGQQCLDPAWELPLWDDYQSELHSNFADIANIGGRNAGTITAACFLSRFTEQFKWAHLDIAGSAWHTGANKAATGRPVGLLLEYLRAQR
ncbi:MAG: leucyl aminopeptidase [Pseudohongiellaceae bacterium]